MTKLPLKKISDYCCSLFQMPTVKEDRDCVLIVENRRILAHKIVLASSSPVFERMFFGKMASDEVYISDIGFKEFKQCVDFIYTGKINVESVINAWSLMYVASKYLMEDLLNRCANYIDSGLTLGTLLLSFEHAKLYDLEKLAQKCLREIVCYTKGVFRTAYHIKPSTWHAILNEKSLNIDKKDLIKFIIEWAMNECVLRNKVCEAKNIWEILNNENLLKHLHSGYGCILSNMLCGNETEFLTIFKEKAYLSKNYTSFLARQNFHLPLACYDLRPWYKIHKNFRLNDDDMLATTVFANMNVAIFGIVVSTEHRPCNATEETYKGSFVIEFSKGDNRTTPFVKIAESVENKLKYDSIHYISFSTPVFLDASTYYTVAVRYKNHVQNGLEVLSYYTGNIQRHPVIITFSNELYGSALRGLSFYPV